MKTKEQNAFAEDLLVFRRTNWQARTYLDEHERGFVRLSVTTNGYQWTTIAILKEAIPEVVKLLKKYKP